MTTPIEQLIKQHQFDVTTPSELLIVEHRDSDDQHRLSPLVIVTDETGYRVSVSVFNDGEMRPSQSVTFDHAGRAVFATNVWGSEVDAAECQTEIEGLITQFYLQGESAA